MPAAAVQPRRRSRRFSLIEVVLGLGLIAFGLISIAALFPVGLRANQAAVGETIAAEQADQFLHVFKALITAPDNAQANWTDYAIGLPASKPLGSEPTSDWELWFEYERGQVTYERSGSSREFQRIRQWEYIVDKDAAIQEEEEIGDGSIDDPDLIKSKDFTDIQFAAVCRVWRTPVSLTRYEGGTWSTINFPAEDAIALN
ncbi:MAG: hypothetical protein RBU25_02790, partial [Lentisphaeria bacterium]|nr:hypothetical protein [Lentisphaeria bacterium]